jgi:hypothetical protein
MPRRIGQALPTLLAPTARSISRAAAMAFTASRESSGALYAASFFPIVEPLD